MLPDHLQDDVHSRVYLQDDAKRVVVLIDGDGYIFTSERVNRGARGGSDAADKLCTLLYNRFGIGEENQHVFIYFNKRKLADTMSTNWNVEQEVMRTRLDSFVRGFNGQYRSFNIIDAGGDKQAADMKLLGEIAALFFVVLLLIALSVRRSLSEVRNFPTADKACCLWR